MEEYLTELKLSLNRPKDTGSRSMLVFKRKQLKRDDISLWKLRETLGREHRWVGNTIGRVSCKEYRATGQQNHLIQSKCYTTFFLNYAQETDFK